jgi:hypothetical protein
MRRANGSFGASVAIDAEEGPRPCARYAILARFPRVHQGVLSDEPKQNRCRGGGRPERGLDLK